MALSPDQGHSSSNVANDLMQLASEKSSEKRVELLRRVTDTYLQQGDGKSSAEKYLFDELVSKLVDKIDGSGRAQASSHFSKMEQIPDSLAHRLATDTDIEVARPMVQDYRGLSEQTLIEVARKGSQDHLHAVASRPLVTARVSDIVVDRGDQRVVRTLAGNKGVQFSSAGMNRLISKAEKDSQLQSLIVDRAALSLEAIGKLLPMISTELVERLQSKSIRLDDVAVEDHLTEWLEDRRKSIARTDAYIEGIRSGNLKLDDVAAELVRGKRVFDFVTVMAATLDMDRDTVFSQLTKGPAPTVLLLLRSIELSWPAVEAFVKLRNAKFFADQHQPVVLRTDYDAIDIAGAQRVVRFMKVRRSAMAPAAAAS